jgi:hypothetical protein
MRYDDDDDDDDAIPFITKDHSLHSLPDLLSANSA